MVWKAIKILGYILLAPMFLVMVIVQLFIWMGQTFCETLSSSQIEPEEPDPNEIHYRQMAKRYFGDD